MIFPSFPIIKPKLSRKKSKILELLMTFYSFTVFTIGIYIINCFSEEIHSIELIALLILSPVFIGIYPLIYVYRKYLISYIVLGNLIFEENEIQIVQGEFSRRLRYLDIRNMILRYSLGHKKGSENALSYFCEIELINKETLTIEILRDATVQPKSFWKRKNKIFNILDEKMQRYKVY